MCVCVCVCGVCVCVYIVSDMGMGATQLRDIMPANLKVWVNWLTPSPQAHTCNVKSIHITNGTFKARRSSSLSLPLLREKYVAIFELALG